MRVSVIRSDDWRSNCYVIMDAGMTAAVVVDPACAYDRILRVCGSVPLTAVLLTHAHYDHIAALPALYKDGIPVCITASDAAALTDPVRNLQTLFGDPDTVFRQPERLLYDGDEVPVGEEVLTVLTVPGHTAGSCVFVGDGFAICGDTVFAHGGTGRTDLPGALPACMGASVGRILARSPDTVLYPGHGDPTTVRQERLFHNPD